MSVLTAGASPQRMQRYRLATGLEHMTPAERAARGKEARAAVPMASDLSRTPVSGLAVQACGDAHLSNFGIFGSAERLLVFDVNDFDETLPGPWEWDVKRLAASVEVAARGNGFPGKDRREI